MSSFDFAVKLLDSIDQTEFLVPQNKEQGTITVAAKSIRTPAVSPSDSSVKDHFLLSHNSAKKRFQELKKISA